MSGAPEGFEESRTRGPFSTHNGPFFHKVSEDGFAQGFRVLPRHCNSRGIVHGGMLMTFADGLLATAVWRATGKVGLTVRMNSDFLSIARPGEWVEGTAEVTRAGRSLVFAEARVNAGTRLVLTASGVFKVMERHKA